MKKTVVICALALCGCSPSAPTAYKAGSTGLQRQSDYDQCRIASFREIPQTMVSQVSPGYSNPGTISCNTIGSHTSCQRVGAINIPASVSTYDANDDLRYRYMLRCMSDKGYSFTNVPTCPSAAERQKAFNTPQPASIAEVKCNAGVSG